MEVSITVRHTSVPRDIKEKAKELVEKLSKKASRPQSAKVILNQEHEKCLAELTMHLPGGHIVVASAEENDFRTALDRMVERAGVQLDKIAERY